MNNKKTYIEFCQNENELPIFMQPWWLDCICGKDNWDVSIVIKGGQVVAAMPYFFKKYLMFKVITVPRLTYNMGPYLKYPKKQKYFKRLSFEKENIEKLLQQFPSYDSLLHNLHYSFSNCHPFYWLGFQQEQFCTYIIENQPFSQVEKSFENDIRRRYKKALEHDFRVIESQDIEKFYYFNQETYKRQKLKTPYSYELIQELFNVTQQKSASKLLMVTDLQGSLVAASFIVFDALSVYYIMGTMNYQKKNIGAMELVLYTAIEFAMKTKRKFDFEGSAVASIERYFRSYGAKQQPFLRISKTNSKLLKIRELIKNW